MKSFALILLFASAASATKGLDTIATISESTFKCLKQNSLEFYIARIYTSVGTVDNTGISNIKNARAAGLSEVDGYIFPCVPSGCPSAASQVSTAINKLKSAGAKVNYVWVDVEVYKWSSDHTTNRNFITAMVNEIEKLGYKPAIYSNNYNWATIVGDWKGFPHLPLWWANYNNDPGFSKFVAFGGWTKPLIHQYEGNVHGACNVFMDMNYKA